MQCDWLENEHESFPKPIILTSSSTAVHTTELSVCLLFQLSINLGRSNVSGSTERPQVYPRSASTPWLRGVAFFCQLFHSYISIGTIIFFSFIWLGFCNYLTVHWISYRGHHSVSIARFMGNNFYYKPRSLTPTCRGTERFNGSPFNVDRYLYVHGIKLLSVPHV